jgi:ADP-ribose pyrophosphatase YjhB (NUDIX family)
MWLLLVIPGIGAFLPKDIPRRMYPMFVTPALNSYEPPLPSFCADCGKASMELKVPLGDERLRACCSSCGRIEYVNPKVVVSCVVLTDDDACLLAKRAIEPRKGTWGIPQGFMEHGETSRQAAAREVWEETGAVVQPDDLRLRAVYNVPGSLQLVYEARVSDTSALQDQLAQHDTTESESLEVKLFSYKDLDNQELCFPTVRWALDHCLLSSISPVQQRTKFYDTATETWSDFEDEPQPHATS